MSRFFKILQNRAIGKSVATNVFWLFVEKAVRGVLVLTIGVWIARYLGPAKYGTLSFALSVASIFGVIAAGGLKGIVVRDILESRRNTTQTIQAAMCIHLAGSIICAGIIISFSDWLSAYPVVLVVLGIRLIFQPSMVIRYWFESQVESKYPAWIDIVAAVLLAATQVVLIYKESAIELFALCYLGESAIAASGLFYIYTKKQGTNPMGVPNFATVKSLIADSWPLLLSSISIIIYTRVDQVMLSRMTGDISVGQYSAALRFSEVWYFVPIIITASSFPGITKLRERRDIYHKKIKELLSRMVLVSAVIALVISLVAGPLVMMFYGIEYAGSENVLAVHVWTGLFASMGVVSGKWMIAESLQKIALYRNMAGMVVNILLNMWLIPIWGPVGAAIASLVACIIAFYLVDLVFPKTRSMFKMKTEVLFGLLQRNN